MLRTGENQHTWASLLEAATTWLCLLVHWPFHTAWLSLFLEEHYSCTIQQPVPRRSSVKSGGLEAGSPSTEDDEAEATASTTSQPVLPNDTLSMLYSRVLERYG